MKNFQVTSPEHGFSLLEVLLAIAILSVGLLGMLLLMINSMRITTSSNYRSIAAQLAYSMADSMRSNPTQLANYDQPDTIGVAACFTAVGCGAIRTDLVNTEYTQWRNRISAALPGGVGMLCRDASPNDASIVGTTPTWNCAAGTTAPYVVKVCWSPTRETIVNVPTCTEIVL
jgi:type IV pilus assembly protein PilV